MAHKFQHEHHHKLTSEERQKMLPVDTVIERLGNLSGLTILDVGCGSGYFSLPLAKQAEPGGHVYAIDTSAEMLGYLAEQNPTLPENLTLVHSLEVEIPLDDGVADMVFQATVYHEFENRPTMLRELLRLSSSNARHVVIDWNPLLDEHGPPMEHRLPVETVIADYEGQGFELTEQFEPGENFYGLIFAR